MNKMILRNVGLIFGEIDNYSNAPGNFTPYFLYVIGSYKDDYRLYFPKLPNAVLYYNSIFLKLWAYNSQDAIKYMEVHYDSYPDKNDFLLFLKRQLQFRLDGFKKGRNNKKTSITKISLEWVEEKLLELKRNQNIEIYNDFISTELIETVKNELQNAPVPAGAALVDQLTNQICLTLQEKLGNLVLNTETKLMNLTDKYETSNIKLADMSMKNKLITLFLCLKNLAGKPSRNSKVSNSLFTKMDLNDIAQILRLHFAPYKGLKIDSIEKQIYEVNNSLRMEDPTYAKLNVALQKFFFNS